jgi:hypothetical protein
MVNGELHAQGSSADRIHFNGGELRFTQYSNGWNESSSSGCIIENSVLSSDLTVDSSLKINNVTCLGSIDIDKPGKPVISNSTLRGGISIRGDGTISNNTILDHGITVRENATITMNTISCCSTGIQALTYYWDSYNPDAWPNCSSVIEGNLIIGNTNGIVVREHQGATAGRPFIRNNTIVGNSVGISVSWIGIKAPSPTILYNNIYDNLEYNLRIGVPDDITAAYNWWGTNDAEAISQMIYDFEDDFELGTVNFVPFLNETNPNIPEVITMFSSYEFSVFAETKNFDITAVSNSILSELSFSQTLKKLQFTAEGLTGTTGLCTISIPADLMFGTFSVFKDDAQLVTNVDYAETYNGTHYMFEISYDHSSHNISIISSQVIPDFPVNILMVGVFMLLSITVLSLKKLWKTQN